MFESQSRLRVRTAPGNLVTSGARHRTTRRWQRPLLALAAALAATAALSQPALAATDAPSATFTSLTLINGWGTYPSSANPAVADVSGIVTFMGAISTSPSNSNDIAFILPVGFRPAKYVNVPVDMCDDTTGELNIAPDGTTEVISSGSSANATCFTSLDGASFALSTASYKGLKLQPGWKLFDNLFRKPSVGLAGGFVRLAGEMQATGKSKLAFILPPADRPASNVFIPINLCTGSIGTLDIRPNGMATAQPPGSGNFWMDKCGVSLDGVSFALSPKSFTALTLKNGWKNSPDKTAKAAVRAVSGIVHFRGAISTKANNADPFVLAAGFRPAHVVYVLVALCTGNQGRLQIQPDGTVAVETQGGVWPEAQCLTSLDGVSFAR